RDRGQENPGRRGIAERGRVVLGEMVAIEPGPVVGLDQLQPLLEELADGHIAVVQMVKDPEAHFLPPEGWTPPQRAQLASPSPSCSITWPFRIASVHRPRGLCEPGAHPFVHQRAPTDYAGP